jgi:hypothetical protein
MAEEICRSSLWVNDVSARESAARSLRITDKVVAGFGLYCGYSMAVLRFPVTGSLLSDMSARAKTNLHQPRKQKILAAVICSVHIFNRLKMLASPVPSLCLPNTNYEDVDNHKLPQNDTPDVSRPAILVKGSTTTTRPLPKIIARSAV